MTDKDYLKLAIDQARESVAEDGFPAGAIVVKDGEVVASGISIGGKLNDPSAHAEMVSIRQACFNLKTSNLSGATLYASLNPCSMCFCSANWAGISRIVFGCQKSKEMIEKGYYEGQTDIIDLNKQNNRQIELVYLPDFESEILNLVEAWEKKIQSQ